MVAGLIGQAGGDQVRSEPRAEKDAMTPDLRAILDAIHNVCLPREVGPGPTIAVPLIDIERLRATLPALQALAESDGPEGGRP